MSQIIAIKTGSSSIWRSPNGDTWSEATPTGTFKGAAYNGVDRYVAVGTNVCATSPDGAAWTIRTIPARPWLKVIWDGVNWIAVGGDATSGYIATSPDGITWTESTSIPFSSGTTSYRWECIAAGRGCLVAGQTRDNTAGTDSTVIARSTDNGLTWSTVNLPVAAKIGSIGWCGDKFVALVGSFDGGVTTTTYFTSPDGITWTQRAFPTATVTGGWYSVNWNGSQAVVTGYSKILTSPDGVTWTDRGNPFSSSVHISGCAWNGTRWVAVNSTSTEVRVSVDGITWSAAAGGPSTNLRNAISDSLAVPAVYSQLTWNPITAASAGSTQSFGSAQTWGAITASGSGYTSAVASSYTTLSPITASGSGVQTIPEGVVLGDSQATLPARTATGAGVQLNTFFGTSAQTLPARVATGSTGSSSAQTLPTRSASGAAYNGALGASAQTLPGVGAVGLSAFGSAAVLAPIQAAGTASPGTTGSSAKVIPFPVAAGTGRVEAAASSSTVLPAVLASGSTLTGVSSGSGLSLGRVIAAAQGVSGTVGSSTLILPVMSASGAVLVPAEGLSAAVFLPSIQARGTSITPKAGTSTTVVMQTESTALSTYANFGFNSFAKFNGKYLAASDAGIFTLEGDLDHASIIDALVRTGVTNHGTEFAKRIDKMYVGYKASGDMVLKVIANDAEYEYPLAALDVADPHQVRVKVGRGLQAAYWQYELRNESGASFEIDNVVVTPEVLSRRTR